MLRYQGSVLMNLMFEEVPERAIVDGVPVQVYFRALYITEFHAAGLGQIELPSRRPIITLVLNECFTVDTSPPSVVLPTTLHGVATTPSILMTRDRNWTSELRIANSRSSWLYWDLNVWDSGLRMTNTLTPRVLINNTPSVRYRREGTPQWVGLMWGITSTPSVSSGGNIALMGPIFTRRKVTCGFKGTTLRIRVSPYLEWSISGDSRYVWTCIDGLCLTRN